METFRGHKVENISGVFYYCDNGEPTVETWKDKSCGNCGEHFTKEGHDGCLGTLPNIRNACCGHGGGQGEDKPYIQFLDGFSIQGQSADYYIKLYKKLKS